MTRHSLAKVAYLGVLLASLAVNLLQGTKILRLEAALDIRSPGEALAEGAVAPSLDLKDEAGRPVAFSYGQDPRPTLLYVFSPYCVWCERNAGGFKALLKGAGDSVRVIQLSLSPEGLERFRVKFGIGGAVFVPTPQTIASYHLRATPVTILVSSSGIVLRSWSGANTGPTKAAVEGYFGFELSPS